MQKDKSERILASLFTQAAAGWRKFDENKYQITFSVFGFKVTEATLVAYLQDADNLMITDTQGRKNLLRRVKGQTPSGGGPTQKTAKKPPEGQVQKESQSAANLQLKRTFSGKQAKDNLIILRYSDVKHEGGKIKASIKLENSTLTWVYAEQDYSLSSPTKHVVSLRERVYLLGPGSSKDFGVIEFAGSSYLQFNAQSPVGLSGEAHSPKNRILIGALAIDLMMRGIFNRELPINAFAKPVVIPIEVGLGSVGPLFDNITSHCSGALGNLGYSLVQKDINNAINALGKFALCTKGIKDIMRQWLLKYYSNEAAEGFLKWCSKQLVDILDAPSRVTLMGLLTKYTLAAPPQSWVRIEAIGETSLKPSKIGFDKNVESEYGSILTDKDRAAISQLLNRNPKMRIATST